MTEKIGSDVLGVQARREMEEKKKKELLRKLAEEKNKKGSDEIDGKEVPSEETPGSKPYERKPGEGADLVNVRQHRRRHPRARNRESRNVTE